MRCFRPLIANCSKHRTSEKRQPRTVIKQRYAAALGQGALKKKIDLPNTYLPTSSSTDTKIKQIKNTIQIFSKKTPENLKKSQTN
jgi:hypothetical protein